MNEAPGSNVEGPATSEVRSAGGTAIGCHGAAGPLERFATLSCEILLLGGSRNARNLTASLDGLSRVPPNARRVVLHGTGHTSPDNGRQPARVAAELHRFFSG